MMLIENRLIKLKRDEKENIIFQVLLDQTLIIILKFTWKRRKTCVEPLCSVIICSLRQVEIILL
jgi:hypothetical protein